MEPFPHHYTVAAAAQAEGDVTLRSANLTELRSAPPAEFGGPGDRWSPETLVVAAVADCFILTFRALADAAGLPWISLRCATTGTLDRVDRVTQFTSLRSRARLHLPIAADARLASHLLTRAEERCLITNSLKATSHLDTEIVITAGAEVIATIGPERPHANGA